MPICACGCGEEARRKWATDQCKFRSYNGTRDRKEYDKGRKRKGRSLGGKHRHMPKGQWPFPAAFIDGEAFADVQGDLKSVYSLLQLRNEDGSIAERCTPYRPLTTQECLSLLFETKEKAIFGFSLGYDISNWLVDLSVQEIRTLRDFGQVRWKQYRITWIPGKMLKVIDFSRPQGCGDRQRTVYDLFPFCQKSFISSLADWKIEVPDIVVQGKAARGTFTWDDMEYVATYNLTELDLMGQLYRSIGKALDAADLRTNRWTGPGSVARLAFKHHSVGSFRAVPNEELQQPDWVTEAVEHAYFGGRFECSYIGKIDAAYEYDLISAYPHAISRGLPCWAHGEWVVSVKAPSSDYALGLVSWKPRQGVPPMWGPFPSRTGDRNLCYPASGEGWYHRTEVENAIQWLGDRFRFSVKQWISWNQCCDCQPWGWVKELADERARIKHTEPGKGQAIKLCLNSLYGILADSAGIGPKPDPSGYIGFVPGSDVPRVSKTRDRFSAGLITARTRARLLEAIGKGWEDVLYIATDGVHSRQPLSLPLGKALGDWEEPDVTPDAAIYLLGGVYAYQGREVTKIRGVRGARGYTFGQLSEWLEQGSIHLSSGSRFCGCFAAASQSRFVEEGYRERLNRWSTDKREQPLDLSPRRTQREDGRWIAPTTDLPITLQNLMHREAMQEEYTLEDELEVTDWGE